MKSPIIVVLAFFKPENFLSMPNDWKSQKRKFCY